MQLTKRYEEMIERDASEISILWKILQVFFYLVNAVAGYTTTYTFYMFEVYFNRNHNFYNIQVTNFLSGFLVAI